MAIIDQRVQAELSKAGSSQQQINSNKHQYRFDRGTSSFASGLSRVKTNVFTQHFSRYPLLQSGTGEKEDDEDSLIFYNYPASFPSSNNFGVQYDVGKIPLFHDIKEATQNCLGLNVVPIKSSAGNKSSQCTAIVGQYESYHTLRFEREKQRNEETDSYLYQPASWYSLPNLDEGEKNGANNNQIYRQHWSYLRAYLRTLDDNLSQLREFLSFDTNRIIIATTCCHNDDEQFEKLSKFMCLLNDNNQLMNEEWKEKIKNQFLIFASNIQTYSILKKSGVKVFFDDSWTKNTRANNNDEYTEDEYIRNAGMNMLSLLDCNIFYIPNLANWSLFKLQRQIQSIEESSSLTTDVILYNRKQKNHNKFIGAWYIHSNPTTKYFLASILFSYDRILLSGNSNFHSTFDQILQEHSSLFNLQISVINDTDEHTILAKESPCKKQLWMD